MSCVERTILKLRMFCVVTCQIRIIVNQVITFYSGSKLFVRPIPLLNFIFALTRQAMSYICTIFRKHWRKNHTWTLLFQLISNSKMFICSCMVSGLCVPYQHDQRKRQACACYPVYTFHYEVRKMLIIKMKLNRTLLVEIHSRSETNSCFEGIPSVSDLQQCLLNHARIATLFSDCLIYLRPPGNTTFLPPIIL